MKIFHIADLHLGPAIRSAKDAFRGAVRNLQKTIDKANGLETDIFVTAGDLFERTSMKVRDIQKAV